MVGFGGVNVYLRISLLFLTASLAAIGCYATVQQGAYGSDAPVSATAAGSSVYSDFNGDGNDDLAIGACFEDFAGTLINAGAVNVIYGSATGLSATTIPDQIWSQDSSGIEEVAEPSDCFGYAMASSDFNNDGYSDIAIGVPGEDIVSSNVGAVHVIYGSSGGLRATPAVDGSGKSDQLWTQESAGVEGVATGNDNFGTSLTAGDYNGDGYADLAVGTIGEKVGTLGFAGGVNVIYGSSQGLRATAASDGTGKSDQLWTQDSIGIEDTAEYNDEFGISLDSGDFNNDGYSDIAIGVQYEDFVKSSTNFIDAGAVNVIYGSSQGLKSSAVAVSNGHSDQLWSQDSVGVENIIASYDYFGSTLAVGDFNNDGYSDLAIGVPREDFGSFFDAGAVNVIYGSSQGLKSSAASDGTGKSDQLWSQDSVGVEDVIETSDLLGTSLATGDFNNDGYSDLAIGVPREDVVLSPSTFYDAGAVNVIYGSSQGLKSSAASDGTGKSDQLWSQNSASIEDAAESYDGLGTSLATGDFNNDGYSDLAIGVPYEDVGSIVDAGAVNVIYGSSQGLRATAVAVSNGHSDQLWSQDSVGVEDLAERGDLFANSMNGCPHCVL